MIDLSQLPVPTIIDALSFEDILAQLKADALVRLPELAQTIELESEPVNILLQTVAYRELVLRARINDAAKAVMLAYAAGADLDQIGANYGVARLVITPAQPNALPPVDAVMEADEDYRPRILLSLDRYSTAGSEASYKYHAMSASAQVQDARGVSPTPGYVTCYVLSTEGNGAASPELLAAVTAALNQERVRPLTDNVTVLSASIVPYAITAHLVVPTGPDAETIRQAAQAAAAAYAVQSRRLDTAPSLSGIYRALHQPGVLRVELAAPAAEFTLATGQAAHCTGITLTVGV